MSFHAALLSLPLLTLPLAATGPEWTLVWADEFDSGSRPDPRKWVFDLGGHGWGNHELQTYTDRPENARIEAGLLLIEARRETFTGPDGRSRAFTSARLKTQGRAEWTQGRLEARLQLPRGQGVWPAFWALGTNFTAVGWPQCGEIDIMENIGREPGSVHGTVHGPGYSGSAGIGRPFKLPAGEAFADAFHVFAVEWDPGQLRWFVDGQTSFTLTPAQLPAGQAWVFDHPHFLLLNLAIGGDWPGAPDATTQFPQQLRVDYVRVYTRTNRARAR